MSAAPPPLAHPGARAAPLLEVPAPNTDWRGSLRAGWIVLALSVGLCGGWAAFAHVNSAVVANGTFAVESHRQSIQHLEGGIVEEILARDGDRVEAGQVLLRLDTTRSQAATAAAAQALAGALATEARLVAQRDMADFMVLPEEAASLMRGLDGGELQDNYREFEQRRQVLAGSLELLDTQGRQARNDIAQTKLDAQAASDQLASIARELKSVRPLFDKGLVALSRLTTLERQKAQFEGTIRKSRNDERKGLDKLAEIEQKREALRKDYRQEASAKLIEVGRQIAALRQERQVALDTLSRSAIRSPVAGTVQASRQFTVGGVVRAGETILEVVPEGEEMRVRVRIPASEIDRVHQGMAVEVHPGTLMKFRRERVTGRLVTLSRDTVAASDPSQPPAYAAEVEIDRDTLPADVRERLVAGMDASVVIPTEGRSVLEYLVQPVLRNVGESLRER
ncbi:HlyD family type I secretion periplasmic adaptor subunit [Aureimonas flava]|uniref:Membrane fusion protein (MFP) family protein n=1 Tax=Aureimonas flava TaxID=2320271 RepID=A0A3A1WR50_9HYPH|nr:HlyD family type I secretion periplasmic adaptor subunit [Aureimonas flava]RIY02700.1 HlyD family type I secretion periplasmic adaptor subunit [Aureimonas flava]